MVAPRDIGRIAGLPAAIAAGDAPVALVRMVERPDVAYHLGEIGAASTELALHLRQGTITAVDDARAAGELVARRAQERIDVWNNVRPGVTTPDDRFPFNAALMARDGQWYVAGLVPRMDGVVIENHPHAAYVLNNGIDSVATRQAEELRLISHGSSGFVFRRGLDDATMRRTHELPQTVLGDGYQASIVDAQVERARSQMPAFVTAGDQLTAKRHGLELAPSVRIGDRVEIDMGHARNRVRSALSDASHELQRLLPDERAAIPADDVLRAGIATMRDDVDRLLETIRTATPGARMGAHIDVDEMRATIRTVQAQLDALGPAPNVTHHTQLAEFDALIERLTSGNLLARDAAMRTFDYELFGRTPGERMRNVGVAMETLQEHVGFGDQGVYRLKKWLLSVADDAALARSELPPEHQRLTPLLDQVEEHARRNGKPGIVVNAQGVAGYEDFPDFAEVGRMGAALRTYLAIDDATGRMAPAISEAIPSERLVW